MKYELVINGDPILWTVAEIRTALIESRVKKCKQVSFVFMWGCKETNDKNSLAYNARAKLFHTMAREGIFDAAKFDAVVCWQDHFHVARNEYQYHTKIIIDDLTNIGAGKSAQNMTDTYGMDI